MLFHVHMTVRLPHGLPAAEAEAIKAREKAYSQELQRSGQYANISVFDEKSNDELHQLLSTLPLFPYMEIKVTPLADHPSALPELQANKSN